jgi:hypothetical protein
MPAFDGKSMSVPQYCNPVPAAERLTEHSPELLKAPATLKRARARPGRF